MSDNGDLPSAIPAGWYADPANSAGKRWWDGKHWTEEVQTSAPLPMSTFGGAAPLARTENAYVPLQNARAFERATQETGIAYTRSVWWICAQPLWDLVGQAIIVALLDVVGTPPILPVVLGLSALNVVFVFILVRLAFADRSGLLAGGNKSAASPWWMLLSPLAYLIARALEVRRWEVGGWAPVVWWSIAMVVSPGLAVLGVFAVFGLVAV